MLAFQFSVEASWAHMYDSICLLRYECKWRGISLSSELSILYFCCLVSGARQCVSFSEQMKNIWHGKKWKMQTENIQDSSSKSVKLWVGTIKGLGSNKRWGCVSSFPLSHWSCLSVGTISLILTWAAPQVCLCHPCPHLGFLDLLGRPWMVPELQNSLGQQCLGWAHCSPILPCRFVVDLLLAFLVEMWLGPVAPFFSDLPCATSVRSSSTRC